MKSKTAAVYSVSGAARALSLSENTIRRLTDEGKLTCARDQSGKRMFTEADLEIGRAYADVSRDRRKHATALQLKTTTIQQRDLPNLNLGSNRPVARALNRKGPRRLAGRPRARGRRHASLFGPHG